MEKRLVVAFALILVFFVFWSQFGPQPVVQQTALQEDIDFKPIQKPAQPPEDQIFDLEETEEELPTAVIGNVIITYSETGGYVAKMSTNQEELPFRNIGIVPADKDKQYTAQIIGNKIEFTSPQGQKKIYAFDGYNLNITLETPTPSVLLFSNHLHPSMLYQRYQEVFYSQNNSIKRTGPKKIENKSLSQIEFAGARDRYYCISLLKGDYQLRWQKKDKVTNLYLSPNSQHISLYVGPQSAQEMAPYGLESIIYYGFFHGIAVVMIKLLHILFAVTKNWGVSIVCFAVFIYFILFPFTSKSAKAMKRIQQIQPEMEGLKEKYKDNPQKLQKETIELYRKYKINPLGGCLPLFFQFPIFIALYQALLRLVELKGAQFLWIKDLSLPDHFIKIPTTPPFYINLLPILIIFIGLIQQKVTTGASSSSQQKSMGLFFAVFIGVIFYGFPSALVLYWLVQNILTLTYQSRISKGQPEEA